MPRVLSITKKALGGREGFSVIEVLLAVTIFGFLVVAVIGAMVYGRNSSHISGQRIQAQELADEGVEAIRNIRDAGFATLVVGSGKGLSQASGIWALTASPDVSGVFTRSITIANGTTINRRIVTATVTWTANGGGTVVSTAELSNYTTTIKLWTAAPTVPSAGFYGSANIGASVDATKVAVAGKYAYVVLNTIGVTNFAVIDISNPASPALVGTVILPGNPTNVAVSGNYAYVTNTIDSAEMQVVNISVPASPSLAASLDITGTANGQGIFVNANYAYVVRASDATAGTNEFNVVNITTPTAPTVSGGYNNDISMNEVWVTGNYAYVATSSTTTELLRVNVTTPATPVLTNSYNAATSVAATTITGYGNIAFLGMGTTFNAVNITNPASAPTSYSTFAAASSINDVALDATGTQAFLVSASAASELQVVNIANATASMAITKAVDITSATTSTGFGVAYSDLAGVVAIATGSDLQELQIAGPF